MGLTYQSSILCRAKVMMFTVEVKVEQSLLTASERKPPVHLELGPQIDVAIVYNL